MNLQTAFDTSTTFLRHPVTQAEALHQERVMENTRAGSIWIGLAYLMTYPALLLSTMIYIGALMSQIIPGSIVLRFEPTTVSLITLLLMYLIAMSIALYVVVSLVTFGLSASSILREKQGKTWDTLLLTGVDARQLVRGKWWATLVTLWKDYALVWLLRLGMIVWLMGVTDGEFFYRLVVPRLSPEMAYLLAAAFLVAVYTMLDAMLTAGLGQIAALADARTSIVVFLLLALRLIILIVPLISPVLIFIHYEVHEASFYIGFWVVCLLIHAALIWLLLRAGQWLAVRQQVLAPVRATRHVISA
jgi:hypothetical protein